MRLTPEGRWHHYRPGGPPAQPPPPSMGLWGVSLPDAAAGKLGRRPEGVLVLDH